MRITPTKPNMACAIIAAAVAPPRERQPRVLRRAALHERRCKASFLICQFAALWFRWASGELNAADGIGTRFRAIPFGHRTQSSVGAVIEVVAEGVPAGLGAPIYAKLDGELAAAMMSINAVKGVEIGDGFAAAALSGAGNADEMRSGVDGPEFTSNHAGGVLGGISTGQPVVVRFAVKPTSSILTPRATIDRFGNETEIVTKGRHDPCVGIRAVPVGEAMMACVLLDQLLLHRGQVG